MPQTFELNCLAERFEVKVDRSGAHDVWLMGTIFMLERLATQGLRAPSLTHVT